MAWRKLPLFQAHGIFRLHSGEISTFMINCEALTYKSLEAIAQELYVLLPGFGSVEGVPRGGLRLAKAMKRYVTEGPLLIVDDVYTTGRSLEEHRAGREAIGAVIFARKSIDLPWVRAFMEMRGKR